MAEQDAKSSAEDGEHPSEDVPKAVVDVDDDYGVDGEIDDDEAVVGANGEVNRGKSELGEASTTSHNVLGRDAGDSKKHRNSSDRRRHHHHHHRRSSSNSHRDHRRRRSGGHSETDGDTHGSDEENRGGSGRTGRRSDSTVDSFSDHSSPRKHRDRRSSRSSSSHGQSHRARQSFGEPESGELPESQEDPLVSHTLKRTMKDKRESAMETLPEKGEAEDGEILEDGELDDDEEEVVGKGGGEDSNKEDRVSPPKRSPGKEDKAEKHEKKKPDHKDRRKRESDEKRKRKKHSDTEEDGGVTVPSPAWGSGYQAPKPKTSSSASRAKQSRHSKGSKAYHSPPGLYDSPSYSENSDEESIPTGLLTEGYVDASVAADEKEGIFNRNLNLKKKKKRERNYDRMDRKRGRNQDSKFDGPPKKKPLVDLAMSERPVCKFYMEGKCAKGSGCPFNHDVESPRKKNEVCKYHLTVKGCHKERCLYMHEDFPCKYYHTGAKCYSGDRCKFSHDPLTEETRRALEMRVAAEDIVDMENPDYDYDYRPREFERMRPSLLGSPPRMRPDMKKIPSLFEIEVHPPGQSPKPSPQTVRPSGFYNETTISPKPGMGTNNAAAGGPMNSPNMGMMNNAGGPLNQGNQQGPQNNQNNMGGTGMMAQMRPGNMMGGPSNRPGLMMGNAQGMGPQQQRPGAGAPIQFMGPGQMNNNTQQSQGGNLPPILNMIGSIIREAAMQRPGTPTNLGQSNMGSANMGPNNMAQRSNNMGQTMNNMGPNNMRQGNMNMPQNNMGNMPQNNLGNNMAQNNMTNVAQGQNSMGNMPQNNMGNMPQNNMGNMPQNNMGNMPQNNMASMPQNNMANIPQNNMNNLASNNVGMGQNMMGPPVSNMGQGNSMTDASNTMGSVNNIGPNATMCNTMGPNNMAPNNSMPSIMDPNNSNVGAVANNANVGLGQPNMGQEVGIMDVDYRIKRDYEEMEEASQDLTELDKIRRQIQEQIEKEEEGEQEEDVGEGHEEREQEEDKKIQIDHQLSPERSEDSQSKDDMKDDKAALKAEVDKELEQIQIPAHLPKKQRELFIRIQQQQLLREKEKERQEAAKAAEEAEAKAEVDDWYSSDEDGDEESKPKLTDVLKKLSQETSSGSSDLSSVLSSATANTGASSSTTTATSTASAFNIMQMINAIKSQTVSSTNTTATKPTESSEATLQSFTQLSTNTGPDPRQRKNSFSSSPASPPLSSSATKPPTSAASIHHPSMPSLHLPALTVDPPVVSARPMKPLPYAVVKISLPISKPYTELPDNLNVSDPAFKNDPRVKWHLQYIEKNPPKEVQKRPSEDSEKSQRQSDPRLKKGPSDPRLAKAGDSPASGRGDGSRPVDPRLQRSQPQARPVDPRLARAPAGNMDPRLNRQNSQDGGNFMGGPMNPNMNNMGGMMGNQMGGMMNNQMGLQMGGPMNNMGGGLMNNRAGLINNPSGPMNNALGGHMGQMNMGMNNMGGPVRQMQGGVPVNNMNMMAGPMGKMGGGMGLMGPGPNQNRMVGPQGLGGNMGVPGNMMSNQMERPMVNQGGGLMSQAPAGAMGMSSGPRLGVYGQPSDPRGVNDPRMKNRPVDPREQRMNPKDPRASGRDPRSARMLNEEGGLNEQRSFVSNDPRSFQGSGDFRQSPNDYQQSPNEHSQGNDILSSGGMLTKPTLSQGREEWRPSIDESLMDTDERNPPLPVSTSSVFMSSSQDFDNDDYKQAAPKFDYRNDPRFKRVKRSTGQRKGSMEYSSPLGGEGQGGSDDGGDSAYNSYNRPKVSNKDNRRKNAPSPTLPDTLQDFDLPETPPLTVTEPEPDLKVKDLFSTIDPTASPFC